MSKKYNPLMPSQNFDMADYRAFANSSLAETLAAELRFDSKEDASVFFARELDHVKAQTYDVLYPEFTALNLFPVSSEVNVGAESITFYGYDRTSKATNPVKSSPAPRRAA